jgi:hypothetical protein
LWRAPPSRPTTSWVHQPLRFLHLEHTLSCTTVITWLTVLQSSLETQAETQFLGSALLRNG